MTTISDWYELPRDSKYNMRSANNVPYPLDDYLALQCKPTIRQVATLVKMLGGMGKSKNKELR